MLRAVRLGFSWLAACVCIACNRGEVRSLGLQALTPRLLEPGTSLVVTGREFPAQGGCALQLRGRTQRPGTGALDVELELPLCIQSAQRLAVELDPSMLVAFGGQGTFHGDARVACRAQADSNVAVSARIQVELDLVQPLGRGTARDHHLERQARDLLALAGLEEAHGEPTAHGLVVGAVRAGGPASAAGLRPGDRIVQASGVTIHALRDLAPAPGTRRIDLWLDRAAPLKPLQLTLDLRALDAAAPLGSDRASLVSGFALGGITLLRPLRARVRRLLLRPWPAGASPRERIGLWGGRLQAAARASAERGGGRAVGPLTLSAAAVLLVWLEPADFFALRSISLYLGFAALSAALMLMNGHGSTAQRLSAVAEMLGRMLVLGTLIACGCALAGTRTLDGIVAGQGGWPWTWAGLRNPALTLAAMLYVAFASELGAATLALPDRGGGGASSAARLLQAVVVGERVLTNIALCGLGVVLFAGGWQVPTELPWGPSATRFVGALLCVAKGWGFAALLAHARAFRWAERLRARGCAVGCAVTVALCAYWLTLEPAQAARYEQVCGGTLCIAMCVFAGGRTWSRLRSQRVSASARAGNARGAAPVGVGGR